MDIDGDSNKIRTLRQNSSLHKWFKESADECLNCGVCINDILEQTMELQVDEEFIKWLFRRIGRKKYGATSTSKLTTSQVNFIYDEMVKFFAEKVNPPVELPPFPSLENMHFEESN
jgi:hypothetical protein